MADEFCDLCHDRLRDGWPPCRCARQDELDDEDAIEDRAREGGEPPWRGREKERYDAQVQDRIQRELKR